MRCPQVATLALATALTLAGCTKRRHGIDVTSLPDLARGLEVETTTGGHVALGRSTLVLKPHAGERFVATEKEGTFESVDVDGAPRGARWSQFQGPVDLKTSDGYVCANERPSPRVHCFATGDIGSVELIVPRTKGEENGRTAGIAVGATLGGAAVIGTIVALVLVLEGGIGMGGSF